jgi:hypothetical protein
MRQTQEDLGVGGSGPFGIFALSGRAKLGQDVDGGQLQPPVGPTERIAVNGAFKTPSLRNIELTGPYGHHGGFSTLEQVIDFYTGGSHFAVENLHDLDINVGGIGGMDGDRKAALAAFLRCLTDERVRWERAPFDHPELTVPHGAVGDEHGVTPDPMHCLGPICEAVQEFSTTPKVGQGGRMSPVEPFDSKLTPCVQLLLDPGAQVNEIGTQVADVRIALTRKPSADVTVPLTVSNPAQGHLAVSTMVFTPENWADWQIARVTGVQDGVADGSVGFQVGIGSVTSTDARFAGIDGNKVNVTSIDSGVIYNTIAREAESATLVSPMVSTTDATASGSKYISVPNGAGNNTSSTSTTGSATFTFSVTATGTFTVWGLVKAATTNDNAFWAKMDSGTYQIWNTAVTSSWAWDKVSTTTADPVTWTLTPGTHTLKVRWREDGTKLDRIYITSDPAFVPATGQPITP